MPAKARLIASATSSAMMFASTVCAAWVTGICAVGAGIVFGICAVGAAVTGTAWVIGGGGGTVGTVVVIGTASVIAAVTGTAWVMGGALRLFFFSGAGSGFGCAAGASVLAFGLAAAFATCSVGVSEFLGSAGRPVTGTLCGYQRS